MVFFNLIMDNIFYFWIVVGLIFLLIEIGHPGLFLFLSFAIGAGVTAVLSLYNSSFSVHCLTFLGVTFVAFMLLSRWLAKKEKAHGHRTNVYALLAKRAIVTKTIAVDAIGYVKIGGEVWAASSVHNDEIKQGVAVKVVAIKGARLVVEVLHD